MPIDFTVTKDFTGRSLVDLPASDFNGQTIRGCCFSQETPDSVIFPEGMTGVKFESCNLSNVVIPPGNTADEYCQTIRFIVQNDLRDWQIDDNNKPVAVLNQKYWTRLGTSTDPADIPSVFIRRETITQADYLLDKDTEEFKSWFVGQPTITDTVVRQITIDITPERWAEMQETSDFSPFDSMPAAKELVTLTTTLVKGQLIDVPFKRLLLSGSVTYITIEGEGFFKGGIGIRGFDNQAEADAPRAEG